MTSRYYLVVDVEATCCDRNTIPRDETEIIEIGAVMVEAATLRTEGEHATFVRPVRHSQLTPFCTALTSITQVNVNEAPLFPEAISKFRTWMCNGRTPGFVPGVRMTGTSSSTNVSNRVCPIPSASIT